MRIIRGIGMMAVCCLGSLGQQAAAQQTDSQTPQKEPGVLQPAEKPGSPSAVVAPDARFVVKDGAIYIALPGDMLMPMAGGGASGCLPGNSTTLGQIILVAPKTAIPHPVKDQTKKN